MALATLGNLPFSVDPDSVAWSFKMKTAERITLGGKVIQVYGTSLGDMTVSGVFGTGGWQERERFRAQIQTWIQADIDSARTQPLRFFYPSRRWDFLVHIKAYSAAGGSFQHSDKEVNPTWTLVFAVVEDSARNVIKGIQDLYISRLMNGIGWKQTQYNGPDQKAVDDLLSPYGGSFAAYVKAGITGELPTQNTAGQSGAP